VTLFTAVYIAVIAFGTAWLAAAVRRSWRQAARTLKTCQDQAVAVTLPPHPDRAYRMNHADWAEFRLIALNYDREVS
jgi:hypothetical protein